MSKPIDLAAHREALTEAAWEAYRVAALRAQQSLLVEDARAAGRAWRTFLDLFISPEQRRSLGSDGIVPVQFPRTPSPNGGRAA